MADVQELLAKIATYRDQVIEMQRVLVETVALAPENGGEGELKSA